MMIPHHEQAIEMSELAFQNTSNSEVLKIAQEIGDSQSPEIELGSVHHHLHSNGFHSAFSMVIHADIA